MQVQEFIKLTGADFFTGVPDSLLKALCDCLMDSFGADSPQHVIAANEGNAVGIAAGHYLATGKVPLVYLQNSGEGNIINPAASLLNPDVYGIPALFVVGWRGEPGVHDEPQHVFQGKVTLKLLSDMDIEPFVIDADTNSDAVSQCMEGFRKRFAAGKQCAFVIKKGALTYDGKPSYSNSFSMTREEAIRLVTGAAGDAPIVSTTGKASRELFEIREAAGEGHGRDFLTVGSMGHSSSIALGIALADPGRRVFCIDGDGGAIMHMGALSVIGKRKPSNLIHVVINNESHESVGGLPTSARGTDFCAAALACGYPFAICADSPASLKAALEEAKTKGCLSFIEVRCAIGSRPDLGRPTIPAAENCRNFMDWLKAH